MNNTYQNLVERLGSRIKKNVLLAPYTTFKIGGPADFFYEATNKDELVFVVKTARELSVPYFILGGGTNILIGDKGFRGLVVKNNANHLAIMGIKGRSGKDGEPEKTVYVEADSGVIFNRLVRFTLDEGLKGLEMHLGLPGTVGGSIYMNSKWMRKKAFVGDCVHQGIIMDDKSQIRIVPRSYFRFQYGKSILSENRDVLLSVVFSLVRSDKKALWETANESIVYRQKTQPQGFATAGCAFKNISLSDALTAAVPDHTTSTGKLIDLVGLKGYRIGGAEFSSVHANFIINRGNATAADVIELIRVAKEKIKEKFGISIVEEIQRVGDF